MTIYLTDSDRWPISLNAGCENLDEYMEKLDFSVYQSSVWGLVKEQKGWKHVAISFEASNSLRYPLSILVKEKFGLSIIWIPGVPDYLSEMSGPYLLFRLEKLLGINIAYARIFCSTYKAEEEKNLEKCFLRNGWQRPSRKLSSGKTVILSLSDLGGDGLPRHLNRSWKRALRSTKEIAGEISRELPESEEVFDLLCKLELRKKIKRQYSFNELDILLTHFHDRLVAVSMRDTDGTLVQFRAAVLFGTHALDLVAASSKHQRVPGLSNLLVVELIKILCASGAESFDFGGIDEINNSGVARFKLGIGGQVTNYVGEFDLYKPKLLRLPGELMLDLGL